MGGTMIKQRSDETRLEYLARVLCQFMRENGAAAECTIDYDGATCDGYCLANDIAAELGVYQCGDSEA